MIFQTTPGIRSEIRSSGCYYMDILWHAARLDPEHVFLTVHDINHTIYDEFVRQGWMSEECYIYYPKEMFTYLGLLVAYKGHVPSDRVLSDEEFGIMKYNHPNVGGHFVACDQFGNTTYDSWGVSTAEQHGRRESMRLFEYLGPVR